MALGSKPLGFILAIIWLAIFVFMVTPVSPDLIPSAADIDAGNLSPMSKYALAMDKFLTLPRWVLIWMQGFMAPLFIALLFFLPTRSGAQIYAMGLIANHVASFGGMMFFLPIDTNWHHWAAFTHLAWVPALIFLLREWPSLNKKTAYGVFASLVIFKISVSLIFDIPDAYLFLSN